MRGWGLLQGIVIREAALDGPALAAAIDHGLLLVAAGPSVLRMVPTDHQQARGTNFAPLATTLSSLSEWTIFLI